MKFSIIILIAFLLSFQAKADTSLIQTITASISNSEKDVQNARYNLSKYRDYILTMKVAAEMSEISSSAKRKVILNSIVNAQRSILFHAKSSSQLAKLAKNKLSPVAQLVTKKKNLEPLDFTAIAKSANQTILFINALDTSLGIAEKALSL